MRTMLLSFKPEVFESICSGEKIYEHRRVFPNEPIEAYIYISRPVQAIGGIIRLGNKINIAEWKQTYSYDPEAIKRIDTYLEHYSVAMEIQMFQNTTQIPLSEVKKTFPKFLIPQMYYYLDGSPLLTYLQENLKPVEKNLIHKFDKIDSNMICIH